MKRSALYHRVSTVDQNPRAARAELRAAAKRYGYSVAADVEETGSGATSERPGLQEVLELARSGAVDAVIVWKIDRFGRSTLDLLAHLRMLDANRVRFIACSQGLDIQPDGDATSRLLLTMLAAVAEFERSLIKERTRLGMAAARARGVQLGRPRTAAEPLGVDVHTLRVEGLSWPEIAAHFDCSTGAAQRALRKLHAELDAEQVKLDASYARHNRAALSKGGRQKSE